MAKNNVEKEVICSAYGKKGFFKVKAAWDIQRVLFSFVDTSSRKSIDCYLPVARAKALVKKFNSGQLDKMLAKSIRTAEKENKQNPEEKFLQTTVDSQTNVIYDGIGAYRLRVLDQEGDSHNVVVTAETAKELGENFKQIITACDSSFKNHSHTHFSMYYKSGIYQNVKVLFLTGFPFA